MIVYESTSLMKNASEHQKAQFAETKAKFTAELNALFAKDAEALSKAKPYFTSDNLQPVEWKIPQDGAWRDRYKTGAIIMNPYRRGKTHSMSGVLTYYVVEEYYEPRFTSYAGTYSVVVKRYRVSERKQRLSLSPPIKINQGVEDDARNAAYANAHSGAVDVAVQLAELPETLMLYRSLEQTVKNLKRANHLMKSLEQRHIKATDRLDSLNNKFIRNAQRHARQIAKAEAYIKNLEKQKRKQKLTQVNPFRQGSTAALMVDIWMLWRFAIRPLVLTCESLVKDINAKRRRYASYTAQRSDSSVNREEYVGGDFTSIRIDKLVQRSRSVVRVEGYKPFGTQVQQFTYNVPLAIWERIPYSWALDRFIHIGNVLSGLHRPENLKASLGCVSTKLNVDVQLLLVAHEKRQKQLVRVPYADGGPFTWEGESVVKTLLPPGLNLAAKGEVFERSVHSGPGLPSFNYSTWHLAKAADLIGLATQLLRKR